MHRLRNLMSYRTPLWQVFASSMLAALVITWTLEQWVGAQEQRQPQQQGTPRPFAGSGAFPSSDERVPTYTIPPTTYDGVTPGFYTAPKDDYRLGPIQDVEKFETEHHLYRSPFRYKNATITYWWEYSEKGVEIQAERGGVTIVEDKPIVSVTV